MQSGHEFTGAPQTPGTVLTGQDFRLKAKRLKGGKNGGLGQRRLPGFMGGQHAVADATQKGRLGP
jgi:hypothetical protein